MKTPVAQFPRASVEPAGELFFDESLSRIPSVDLKAPRSLRESHGAVQEHQRRKYVRVW
jgi:hypothetical protein